MQEMTKNLTSKVRAQGQEIKHLREVNHPDILLFRIYFPPTWKNEATQASQNLYSVS